MKTLLIALILASGTTQAASVDSFHTSIAKPITKIEALRQAIASKPVYRCHPIMLSDKATLVKAKKK